MDTPPEHFDVLIVGAGLSGIGAGCHLEGRCPEKSYAILEARDDLGGTWDLFRYPGIRSDSDMHTLGYRFKPWTEAKSIADGASILRYLRQAAAEHGVEEKIRFGRRVVRAEFCTAESRWSVAVESPGSGEIEHLSCGFLWMCSGYYSYEGGYAPDFPGAERFAGPIVHPQRWSEEIEYAGKRVVVIGSGATAVTLVPALAKRATHVTMLQRSPSYIVSLPAEDRIAIALRRVLPDRAAYPILRWKNVLLQMASYQLSRRRPELMKRALRRGLERSLPPDYDFDTHFTPPYEPWDQRLCLVPDGDLFKAIGSGRAEIVTERIETFTEAGIRLSSGDELAADLIVTATGLNLLFLGGVRIAVDGAQIEPSERLTYKGMMLSGVPNLAFTLGYSNASWTLKADLTSEYVCRLLTHMSAHGYGECVAQIADPSISAEPILNLTSGYVLRSIEQLPRQGSKVPWKLRMNYALDVPALRFGPLEDGAMSFSSPAPRAQTLAEATI